MSWKSTVPLAVSNGKDACIYLFVSLTVGVVSSVGDVVALDEYDWYAFTYIVFTCARFWLNGKVAVFAPIVWIDFVVSFWSAIVSSNWELTISLTSKIAFTFEVPEVAPFFLCFNFPNNVPEASVNRISRINLK